MRKIALSVLGTAVLAAGFVACNSDDTEYSEKNKVEDTVISKSVKSNHSENYLSFVSEFYNTNFEIGESINLSSKEGDSIKITEIIVNKEDRARGYVMSDINNDEFLLFVDIDRSNDKVTVFDTKTKELTIDNEIGKSNEYIKTEKFDFIKYSQASMATTTKSSCSCGFWKRMWGRCTEVKIEPIGGSGDCMKYVNKRTHFLGLTESTGYVPTGGIIDCP